MKKGQDPDLIVLKADFQHIVKDVGELKDSVKLLSESVYKLANNATMGMGAFKMILVLGGFVGWLAGIGAAIASILK